MIPTSVKIRWILTVVTLGVFLFASFGCNKSQSDEVAVLETTYGRIVIEFLPNVAPKHVENFKGLAREQFYDGTKFHRIIKDKGRVFGIQGGDPNTINGDIGSWGQGQAGQKTVSAEFSTLKHLRGTVSAARRPNDVNSATSQFFILTAAQPGFDAQYSIFGRVIDGMNVVDSIARAPTIMKSEMPIDPVVINRATIVKRGDLKP